jgi:membrane associated rhomboid family serine protease
MKEIINEFIKRVDVLQALAALTVFTAFLFIVYALVFVAIPISNKEAVIHVLGIIEGVLTAIVFFYFGSSKQQKKIEDKTTEK